MNKGYIALWILSSIVLVIDLGMVISILKKGDERRQIIIWKSSTYTFITVIVTLFMDSIIKLIAAVFNLTTNVFNSHTSSLSILTTTTIIYFITLKYNSKKLGD